MLFSQYGDQPDISDSALEQLKASGVDLINTIYGSWNFTSKAEEKADNTWAKAAVMEEDDGYLEKDVWLCGEELADNSVCGFADSVDYMKFTKTSDHKTLIAMVDSDNEEEVSIELLDASGNTIDTIACWSDYSLEELKNGIYGIKVKVDENTHASGMISVY